MYAYKDYVYENVIAVKNCMFLKGKMPLPINIKATKITICNLLRLFLFLLVASKFCVFSIYGSNFRGLPNID